MQVLAALLVGLVAVEHVWFLILEMFLFTKPTGLETFHMTQEAANTCATLAMNQGLYNGFLAAGLVVALVAKSALMRRFALGCVIVAAMFGGYSTGNSALLVVQGLPALIALVVSEAAARRS